MSDDFRQSGGRKNHGGETFSRPADLKRRQIWASQMQLAHFRGKGKRSQNRGFLLFQLLEERGGDEGQVPHCGLRPS